MPTKIITLVQHTPMWHFQPGEAGCGLRATEVKPKLDRFIVWKAARENLPASYWIDPTKSKQTDYFALNYKLNFIPAGKKEVIENSREKKNLFPLFFGNIGTNKEQKKELVYYPGAIEMHIFCLNDGLLKLILSSLNAFFACTGFGTRQSKGFGLFYPKNNPEKENEENTFDFSGASYQFDVTLGSANSGKVEEMPTTALENTFSALFKYIHYFHKMIRSGINEGGVYYKSLMYHYARDKKDKDGKEENWDKPLIRHHFQLYDNVYKTICDVSSHPESGYCSRKEMKREYKRLENGVNSKWLFREALGLSGSQMWKAYGDTVYIESEDPEINRFKSPILYRPVPTGEGKYSIYLYILAIDPQVHQRYYETTFRIRDKRCKAEPLSGMQIYSGFSLSDYLDFVMQHCKEGVKGEGTNPAIMQYIEPVFNGKDNFRKIKNEQS